MEAINDGESHELLRSDGVALKTFHASKGLEYKVVFIIDALEGITPSNKALAQGNLEEERRMFYVALTRAKRECYICFPNQIGEKCYKKSRFIDELKIL
jgi:DNA helicase-2/ATP-dependent DNA helicase PcrA